MPPATRNAIEFGPLVAPVTFRHPTMNVRYAAAIDDLSGGRLVLGLGAGWNDYEHKKFGIPFHDFSTRFRMLEEALHLTRSLLRSDEAVSYAGEYYQLDEAMLLPRPARENGPPILIGGNGPKKTLPLAATFADEWNAVYLNLASYKERRALMREYLDERGRSEADMKFSLMTRVIYRQTQSQLDAFLHENGIDAEAVKSQGWIVGTAQDDNRSIKRLSRCRRRTFHDAVDGTGRYREPGIAGAGCVAALRPEINEST